MLSTIRQCLTKPRSQHRVLAVALGVGFALVGVAFGIEKQFANWGVVAFMVVGGVSLALCGLILPERYLAAFFTACILINMAAAAYALFTGPHVQP